MKTGPRLKVSSDRLVKPGIEPATPGLQGKRFIHYTTAAPQKVVRTLKHTKRMNIVSVGKNPFSDIFTIIFILYTRIVCSPVV